MSRSVRADEERPWVKRQGLALLTDQYELTMMGGYVEQERAEQPAAFDYFFRHLPNDTGYAVFSGLEDLLNFYDTLHFTNADLDYLESLDVFPASFIDYLEEFTPSCTIWAPPEGTLVFPNQPVVRVEGPLAQAQLLETFLLNALNYPTLVATKAARICEAAEGDPVIEFGVRRAQGPDGGLTGARGAYIGGCKASSNVLAGKHFGIPVSGTMAHSWIMSYEDELESFRAYVKTYPKDPVLLVDTYDTLESGVPNAIRVYKEMRDEGKEFRPGIRLDSGDLAQLSKAAHKMFVEAGFEDPLIVASNELDEDLIADLKRQGAKINAWGVGTNLITCKGDPALSGVYKLAAIDPGDGWQPRLKITSNVAKTTEPGRKRPVRYFDENDRPIGDVLYEWDETPLESGDIPGYDRQNLLQYHEIGGAVRCENLLRPVVEQGGRVQPPETLTGIKDRAAQQIASIAEEYKRLRYPALYPVTLSPKLTETKRRLLHANGAT